MFSSKKRDCLFCKVTRLGLVFAAGFVSGMVWVYLSGQAII